MSMSKRTRTVILWGIAIGLLVGMVISFTPTMGLNFGGQSAMLGTPQILVNGEPIREAEVTQASQGTLFNAVSEGPVAEDLERLLVDELVRQKLIEQAAAPIRVSNGDVRAAVDEFREARGVAGRANDRNYVNLIASGGFTDETFRDYLRGQLKVSSWEESLVSDVEVSDAEVEAYYQSHLSSYQSEEQIVARHIVVEDRDLATELREQVVAGASFAVLAAENSIEAAEREGALGAPVGETEPQPVGRPALPTAVANAAFALRGAGLTDVVEAAGAFHIVQVEQYLPASARPLEEVRATVEEDTLTAKQQGVVEAEIERLRSAATVEFPATSTLSFDNPTIAIVGDTEIPVVDLDRATYNNPQIQQALSPETADLITQLFKPAVLDQLIDTELAYQGAQNLDVDLVGSKAGVAQAALSYVSRDATFTEEEVEEYYENNEAAFTLSAEAVVTEVSFADLQAAQGFRSALLDGADLDEAAAENGGTVTEHGRVMPNTLPAELDTAVFDTEAFEALPDGDNDVSDVIVIVTQAPAEEADDGEAADGEAEAASEAEGAEVAADEDAGAAAESADGEAATDAETAATQAEPVEIETFVVLVADRTPARLRPLEDVRAQVETAVRNQNRQALSSEWLTDLRDEIEVREFTIVDLSPETEFIPEGVAPEGEEVPAETPAADDIPVDDAAPAEEVPTEEVPADEPAGDEAQ